MKRPFPGTIVHYQLKPEDGGPRRVAALIIDEPYGEHMIVSLRLFIPGTTDKQTIAQFADRPTPGHWNWLPKTMTPDDPRWEEFREALAGPDYLNFRHEGGGIQSNCKTLKERPLARALLEKMGGYDVEASIEFFDKNGGCCCDCEIVFNVGADRRPPPRRRRNPPAPTTVQ